ncbi:MAG: arginine--tRNA ligase, partial [Lachnospiraceae bacterium]|nr:arginine--tRNA ligase [Lachnospiraceae bacterium]
MEKLLDLISEEMKKAFEEAGYDRELGRVTLSNRPDLCEYQCNGAMAGAKKYHKAPLVIAQEVSEKLTDSTVFEEVSAVAPGFLNLKITKAFIKSYLNEMAKSEKFGLTIP